MKSEFGELPENLKFRLLINIYQVFFVNFVLHKELKLNNHSYERKKWQNE